MKIKLTKNPVPIKKLFKNGVLTLSILAGVLISAIIVLTIITFVTNNKGVLIALIVTLSVLLATFLIVAFSYFLNLRRIAYEELYQKTLSNFDSIANQKKEFVEYNDKVGVIDFSELNKTISNVLESSKHSYIYSNYPSYEDLGFHFIDKEHYLVLYGELFELCSNLILATEAYRSAFICYTYPIKDKELTIEEIIKFKEALKEVFTYSRFIIGVNTENNQLYVFVPNFDSVDRLKEEIIMSFDNISIIRYSDKGHKLLTPKASVVIFPYSKKENIFSDLAYANRQNEDLFFYFPENVIAKNEYCLQNNMNDNFVLQLFDKFSLKSFSTLDLERIDENLNDILSQICNYYGFDYANISLYSETNKDYVSLSDYQSREFSKSQKHIIVLDEFIKLIDDHTDINNAYFFSSRKHVSSDIGKYLDAYGVHSGFIYLFKRNGQNIGCFMLCKLDDISLDFSTRENILTLSRYLNYYIISSISKTEIIEQNTKINNLLKITNLKSYSIDKTDYTISDYSMTLKDLVPNIAIGKKCYEVIYGKNKPCALCPLTNHRKMYCDLNNVRHESSLVLNKPKAKVANILLTPSNKDGLIIRERFDSDLFINTYYAFIEKIRDSFMMTQRGYVVLANIDNINTLQQKIPNESFNSYLRDFFSKIQEEIPLIENLYFIPDKSFAFILSNAQHKEIVDAVEKIHALAKKAFLSQGIELCMNLSYFAHSYPFGYQNPDDFVRYYLSLCVTPSEFLNKDRLFMLENKYSRPASHIEFVNEVLEKSLNKNTFSLKLQPFVKKGSRRIVGAEILLRVSDSFLNKELNTVEIIKASVETNKIGILTDGIIEQIGNLYKEYSTKMFDKYQVGQLSLNTDYSFFQDPHFMDKIKNLEEKYRFPKGFLVFEIQESELAAHYEEFAGIVKTIGKNENKIFCDSYTGKYLPLAKIKELGFTGIKTDRRVISGISDNAEAANGIKMMVERCAKLGLVCTLLGIEFKEQNNALSSIEVPYYLQGYYFYRPLDAHELLNALMTANA